jgi:hypothetical protein
LDRISFTQGILLASKQEKNKETCMDWAAFVTFLGESDEWLIPLLFSIIFALFSIINSTNQSKQQVTQISIELMEKRLQYFNACKTILDSMTSAAESTDSVFETFYEKTFGIEFFFGDDVLTFYKELREFIKAFRKLHVDTASDEDNFSNNISEQDELRSLQFNLRSMKASLKDVFNRYLDFSCYKATGERN